MTVLLVSGLGPTFKNSEYLRGSLLDSVRGDENAAQYLANTGLAGFRLGDLGFEHGGQRYPLLRPRRGAIPHLTTFTLEAILDWAGVEFEHSSTARIWEDQPLQSPVAHDVVLLSTSYIWSHQMLAKAVRWVQQYRPDSYLVLGGQFSNLKYGSIMALYSEVDAVMRGDAEESLPMLLQRLARFRGRNLGDIPNLVWRAPDGSPVVNDFEYIDIESFPSPRLTGHHQVVPYESMRGCPFSCKFCSFPLASPTWRYKSAAKIAADWRQYSEENGTRFIKAMDSTFTVPPTRLRELLDLLPPLDVEWEGYSRANVIKDADLLARLADAHCRFLSLGFESMSDRTLKLMNKRVTRKENLRAFSLLRNSDVGYRVSFMAGYPGETPEDFALTDEFLVNEYEGHFMLSVFSISDETMPLWEDRDRLQIKVHDLSDPDYSWSHIGMDVDAARQLNHATLDSVRRTNDRAVLMLWQADYQHWLLPHRGTGDNLVVEKAVERIGLAPRDVPQPSRRERHVRDQLDVLARHGVLVGDSAEYSPYPLLEVAS
jgi:tRNA A37 methylthiotransferase MiaB